MRTFFIFGAFIIVALTGLLLYQRSRSQKRAPVTQGSKEVCQDLRNLALHSYRTKLGLPPTGTPSEPWGVVMDWGLTKGTATIVAFSDGTASVYLSSGGGFIGGGESNESIRMAAKKMVSLAAECQPHAHETDAYPLPQPDEVKFYLLTDSGVLTVSASQEALSNHRHPLSELGDAGQDVITQYRRVQ